MPIPSHEDRQRRLLQLAEQWGVEVPSATSSLSRPSHPPTYRNTDDDFYAEELVKRRQLSHGRTESTGNLRKAFSSSKKKSYDPKIVFDALNSHVANSGRAGAAESLINLLISSGGDVNLPQKPKQGLLSRRKSLETFGERSRLLQQAVQNGQADMVAVLLPHADTVALDTSLPIAMRNQNTAIVELLLRYGAGAASTADAQDAVRQACVTGGQAEIVSLVLRSEGRPSASWLSQCMIDATRAACVSTVMRLARSTADGSHKQAQALKIAISQGRHDIVLAILLGSKPPRGQGLDEAFTELIGHPSINPNDKISMVEMLLCAGAEGDGPSLALLNSASAEFLEMLHVLVTYGTSIEYRDAMAVRKAISNGRVDVAHILLAGNSPLSSLQASECVELIPKDLALEHRRLLLDVLLRRGASGNPLHDVLIEAVRAGDVKSVNLLVTPQFPGSGRPVESQSPRGLGRRTSKSMVFERHEVASVDYKNGLALQIAVSRGDVPMASVLLASKPSGQTVARVFAETSALPPRDKLGMQRRASSVTLIRALNAAWKLSGSSRLMVLDMLFKAGLPVCEELHICLNKAVNDEAIDEKAIEVLVAHGATPNVKGAKTLVDAAQRALPSVMRLLLEATVTTDALNLTVVQSFTNNNAATWFSDRGFLVLQALILKGAQGAGLTNVLGLVINMVPQSPDLGGRFMDLLFENEVDVDHEDGKLLESATSTNNIRLVQRLLEKHPKTESLSRAFHHIFDQQLSEDEALQLIQVYTEYSNGETRLDVMYSLSDSPPVLFLALARFPRSFRIMKALLDAGFYHDQTTVSRVMPEIEEEETVTLLTWALIQPQKKVSSNIIQLLLDSGAKVNFETRHSRLTPLMLAIHARRPDVTKELLLKDADVDVTDAKGNTPLSLASDIGGDVAITMMSNLLAAGASRNDGSLQNAARELNLAAVQVLVEYGHDPDFPSHLHDGRSALGEICLHGAISGEMTAAREKQIEKVMNFLLDKGSDISVKCSGKSLLHLALESSDPVAMTRLLLKVGMWKLVNKKFNLYRDGVYTYSPTMYVAKILPKVDVNEQLLRLLRANRCEDVFFANRGPQPDDAIGLPDDVALQERERRARLSRLASEQEDYEVSITRSKELAAVQAQIWANQAELEDARRKRAHSEEMEAMGDRARAEEEVFAAAMRRRKNERVSEASHEKAMAEASALKARQEMELDKRRHLQALDWERNMATERVDHAKALSALRIAEREDVERMDRQQDERATRRIAEQRRLVESQTGLAGQLTGVGPQGRRQIGYVAGELNN
ncbi:hypothetical protein ACHAP6_000710 [Verticillium nonalfalfae]